MSRDTAIVNLPVGSRGRGGSLDAQIDRAKRAVAKAAKDDAKASNRDRVVARELYRRHGVAFIVQFAARHGKSTAEVDAVLRRKIQFDPSFARKILSEFAEVTP